MNRNEGLHSVLRGKLDRLVRKTKGYSKSLAMLSGSLVLMWDRGVTLRDGKALTTGSTCREIGPSD